MIRIVFFAEKKLLEQFEQQRKELLFNKITSALIKELGEENVTVLEEESSTLVLDIKCNASFDSIKNFVYESSELNKDEIGGTNFSIFNVSENDDRTSLQDEARKHNGDSFSDYVNQLRILKEKLEEEIYGQSHAINEVVSGLLNAYFKDKDSNSPLTTFTLMGPSGCGKSLLAEKTAKLLFELNGTEYKILNAVDYDKPSICNDIVRFVYSNPRCVLVFNDFLQSGNIADLIISAIETGEYDRVSFKNVIMIFTTKIGKSIYNSSFTGNLANVSEETLINAISQYFGETLTEKLASGKLVMLNFAPQEMLRSVAYDEICKVFDDFNQKTNIEISCDADKLSTAILYMNKEDYTIPTIKKCVNKLFNKELSDLFSQVDKSSGEPLLCSTKKLKFELLLDDCDLNVKNLFATRTFTALIVCKKSDASFFEALKIDNVKIITASTYDDAVQILNNGVDFVLLDVLTGVEKMEIVPTSLEDYDSQGVKIFNYIGTYFREVPLYLLANVEYEIYHTSYASFLNDIARAICYFNKEDVEDVETSISFLQEELEVAKDLATLIGEGKYLAYQTKQVLDKKNELLTIQFTKLSLENTERKLESRYLTSFLSNLKFDDVIGHEHAKKVLKYYSSFLTRNDVYLGDNPPKGFLIYGRSGLGKGLLAKALAGETNATLISYDAKDIVFDDTCSPCEVAKKVKEIFNNAKQCAPAVLLVKNVECLLLYDPDITRATLGEIEKLNKNKKQPVLFIGTTTFDRDEFPDKTINSFDRAIGLILPNKEERRAFIKKYLAEKQITSLSDQAIENVVATTQYNSYSFIRTLIDFAISNARGKELTDTLFVDSYDLYTMGEETNSLSTEGLAETAYHEVGHYLIDYLLGGHPSFVTVVSRGHYLGYTRIDQKEDRSKTTKQDLLNEICCDFAGRAAEVLIYGEEGLSTGVSGDIKSATHNAKCVVCYYGMDNFLYSTRYIENDESIPDAMLERINAIICEQYERALKLLSDNRDKLEALTQALIEKKSLTGDECEKILASLK